MVERKVQKQREKDPYGKDEKIPERGTGRKTGTARTPPGTGKPLTDEERRKRHKEQTK